MFIAGDFFLGSELLDMHAVFEAKATSVLPPTFSFLPIGFLGCWRPSRTGALAYSGHGPLFFRPLKNQGSTPNPIPHKPPNLQRTTYFNRTYPFNTKKTKVPNMKGICFLHPKKKDAFSTKNGCQLPRPPLQEPKGRGRWGSGHS